MGVHPSRLLILIGAVSAWLCGALAGSHALGAGAGALLAGSPEAVWLGDGGVGIVAGEQRGGSGADDEPEGFVWRVEPGERAVGGLAVAGGRSVGACVYLRHVLGARGPPA